MTKTRPAVLLLLLLGGCAVGPNYHRPETPVPENWVEVSDGITAAPINVIQWWTVFHDLQLDSLVDRALRSNKSLQLAEARILQARAQRIVAGATGLPMLDASGSYTRFQRSNNAFSLASGGTTGTTTGTSSSSFLARGDLFQAGLDASWEIDVFGGVRRAVEAANADIGAAQEDFRDTLVTLLGEVATNYFQLRGNQRRIAVAVENIDIQRKTVELTQGRFQAGLASRLEVAQAEALLATTESQIPPLETTVRQSIHQLGVLLGSEPEALLPELSPPRAMPPAPPEVPAGLPSDLLRRRPDIRRSERQLAAATAQIGVAVADLFPKLSLTGSYGFQSTQHLESLLLRQPILDLGTGSDCAALPRRADPREHPSANRPPGADAGDVREHRADGPAGRGELDGGLHAGPSRPCIAGPGSHGEPGGDSRSRRTSMRRASRTS